MVNLNTFNSKEEKCVEVDNDFYDLLENDPHGVSVCIFANEEDEVNIDTE